MNLWAYEIYIQQITNSNIPTFLEYIYIFQYLVELHTVDTTDNLWIQLYPQIEPWILDTALWIQLNVWLRAVQLWIKAKICDWAIDLALDQPWLELSSALSCTLLYRTFATATMVAFIYL